MEHARKTTYARRARRFPHGLVTMNHMEALHENLWPAPYAGKPLNATVVVPGSKSLSNRYLILAALGHRPVRLVGLLRSRDTELMMDALRALGVRCEIDEQVDTTVTVVPPSDGRFHGGTKVFCGLAGTVMRFVPGLAMFADGPVAFDGDEQAYARPMKPVLDGLEQLGACIEYHGEEGRLPFTITPPQTVSQCAEPSVVSIDSSGSSQFISGLLLIGSRVPGGLELHHTGEKTPSLPHIRMTVADLHGSGVRVNADEHARVWTVQPGAVQLPETVTVEPDLSNAAPFLGAALIAGGTVRVPHWPESTTQPGGMLPGYLERMGAEISFPVIDDVRYCEVTGNGHVSGLGDFDLTAAGEIAPSLAAILVFADKPTRMITAMLSGLIYGVMLYQRKPTIPRLIVTRLLINYGSNVLLGSVWKAMLYGKGYLYYLSTGMVKNTIMIPIEVALMWLALNAAEKLIVYDDPEKSNLVAGLDRRYLHQR